MKRRVNPRQMNRLMRQYGLNVNAIEDVQEVVIRLSNRELRFRPPRLEVTEMVVQGARTFQIAGEPEEVEVRSDTGQTGEATIPDEDVELVMSQTGADAASARMALKEADGNPAEAILSLLQRRGS